MEKRRYIAGLLAFLLLLVVGYWGWGQHSIRRQYETHVGMQNQRAFYELLSHVENMEVLLAKALVSGSQRGNIITLSDIWYESAFAQANLSQLPITQIPNIETTRFLNQVGDYAKYLANRSAKGIPIGNEQFNTLEDLHSSVGELARELHEVQNLAAQERLNWSDIRDYASSQDGGAGNVFLDGFRRIEDGIAQVPALEYSGPFSVHLERVKPLGLTGEDVTLEEAKEIAQDFVEKNHDGRFESRRIGEADGNIPAYELELRPVDREVNELIFLHVSKKGGHVVWLINTRPVHEGRYSISDAIDHGTEFLEERGIDDMVILDSREQRNVALLTFVYEEDDIIIYPDTIVLEVALDTNQVVSYDAVRYLETHREREFKEPEVTETDVKNIVSPRMNVKEIGLALITLGTTEEVLCYEVRGSYGEDEFWVYINAYTGEEENLLHIVTTPDGKIIM